MCLPLDEINDAVISIVFNCCSRLTGREVDALCPVRSGGG